MIVSSTFWNAARVSASATTLMGVKKGAWDPTTDSKRFKDFRGDVFGWQKTVGTSEPLPKLYGVPAEYAPLYVSQQPQKPALEELGKLYKALGSLLEQTQADLAKVLKKSGDQLTWDPSSGVVVSTPSLSSPPLNSKDATETHPKAVHAALTEFGKAASAWTAKAGAVATLLNGANFNDQARVYDLKAEFWAGASGMRDTTLALLKAIAPLPDLFEKTAKNWDEAARLIKDGLKGGVNTVLDENIARAAAVRADAKVLSKLGTRLCAPFNACPEPKMIATGEAVLDGAVSEMHGWSVYLQLRHYEQPVTKWSCELTGPSAYSAEAEGTVADALARNMKNIVGTADAGKPRSFAQQVEAFASRSTEKQKDFEAAADAAKGMAAGKKAFTSDVSSGKNIRALK